MSIICQSEFSKRHQGLIASLGAADDKRVNGIPLDRCHPILELTSWGLELRGSCSHLSSHQGLPRTGRRHRRHLHKYLVLILVMLPELVRVDNGCIAPSTIPIGLKAITASGELLILLEEFVHRGNVFLSIHVEVIYVFLCLIYQPPDPECLSGTCLSLRAPHPR